jgi:hypothetical protein
MDNIRLVPLEDELRSRKFGPIVRDWFKVTLPRQTGPDVKFEHHLEEGHDEEDAEAVHG